MALTMEFPEAEAEKSGEYVVLDTLGPSAPVEEGERVGLVSPTHFSKKSQKGQHRARFSSRPTLGLLDVSCSPHSPVCVYVSAVIVVW